MVRFGWPVKSAKYSEKGAYSPPPYREEDHASPVAFPSTTPAIPTIPTHFLTLPVWRKHQTRQASPPQRLSMSDVGNYQQNSDPRRRTQETLLDPREKALPPTPVASDEDAPSVPIEGQSLSNRPSRQAPQLVVAPAMRPSPSRATAALAHASLAIGLPHSMSRASASSSRSDVNSLPLIPIPRSDQHPFPLSSIRRTKSFHQFSHEHDKDDGGPPTSIKGSRRSRGISFGPVNTLDSDGKGKGKALEDIPSHVTPPRKSLARRASFWNRKRNDSTKSAVMPVSTLPPRDSFDHLSHLLPSLPPMSPLHFDTAISRSSQSSQTEEQLPPSPPGLSPRDECRNRPLPPSPVNSSEIPVRLLRPPACRRQRPATADSSVDRSRTFSFYDPSPATDKSALRSPLVPVPSQHLDAATPRQIVRPRSQTNPPLLHRLSANLFSFGSSSASLSANRITEAQVDSPEPSPRTSTSKPLSIKPQPNEKSPAAFVDRLLGTVSKAEIASVLASSGETFYNNALQTYIDRFEFDGDPLDVALRKLLMDVGLPRETQQIDRVMEAFASRYLGCNRSLFTSDDHPYILAFSLIMLHTDAFNKSNKRKMTKADYIRNTRLAGVFPEVLEYYYDNIVFAPFIFVEDPLEVNLQRNSDGGSSRLLSTIPHQHSLPGNGSSVTLLGKNNKIDPYYLIAKNLLGPLRVDVEEYIPLENPYSYEGTSRLRNEEDIHETFSKAGTIRVGGAERRMSTSVFTLNIGSFSSPYPNLNQISDESYSPQQVSELKVAKAGLLIRKDITLDIGKRAKTGKWRSWSVILTNSQLLFFRDHMWATSLQEQMRDRNGRILVPPVPLRKPDEVLSLKGSVALCDRTHDKRDHTFLFISGDRRPFLFQASSEEDVNSWLSCINYASAFKTAGILMRAPGMSGKDVESVGIAAAASHLQDLQWVNSDSRTSRVRSWGRNSDDLIDRLSTSISAPETVSMPVGVKMVSRREDMVLDITGAPDIVTAHQLKATYDQVKADLAAGRCMSVDGPSTRCDGRPRAHSLESAPRPRLALFSEESEKERLSTRTRDIRSKLKELDSKITSLQLQEESDMRLLRNVAVLTPFQRATRERLGAVVLQTSKGIQTVRLELAMQLCHKEVLGNDLVAQEEEWHRTKKIALKAATDTLQSRREPSIPRMQPPRIDEPTTGTPRSLHHRQDGSLAPESSTTESFHTALDFAWPVSAVEAPPDSHVPGRDRTPTDSPSTFSPAQETDGKSTPESDPSHQRFSTALEGLEGSDEEAEEWNKTRAAKRVSLVRMPSTLNVSLGRQVSTSATGLVRMTTHSPRSTPAP
ncbi:hypothetical protein EDB87DRAFT_1804426 [Lactarius vividus]|nr:hypothetical protein EDB87DRAFT_1804426 [Lactarius vividus]